MKTLIVLVCLMVSMTTFGNTPKTYRAVHAHSGRDIFYFKVDCYFRGASVEVYNEKEEKIFSGKITQHKALLDFYYEAPGTYKIIITKGESVEKFDFVKVKPALIDDEQQPVLLTQGL